MFIRERWEPPQGGDFFLTRDKISYGVSRGGTPAYREDLLSHRPSDRSAPLSAVVQVRDVLDDPLKVGLGQPGRI